MKIAFWGNFGTLNFGNECTLAAILDGIHRRLPDAALMVVCVEPGDTAARHQVEAIPIWDPPAAGPVGGGGRLRMAIRGVLRQFSGWRRALRQVRGVDALIVPGTGVLNDNNEGLLGLPYHLFKWCLATRLRGGKVFFVSVGVERISCRSAQFFVKGALGLAEYRSFRDPRALQLIRALGFRGASEVRPDLAFSLPEQAPLAPGQRLSGRTVAVGVYNFQRCGQGGGAALAAYEEYVNRVSSLILWLAEQGYRVRLIMGDVSYDMQVRSDVRARLQGRGFDLMEPIYADDPATSFEQIMDQIASVDFVVASRFHNILLALFIGRPVVALSYEGKIEVLMRGMGLGEYCQTLEEFNLDRLIGQIQQLEREAPALYGTIAARVREHRDDLDQQYDLIAARLRLASNHSNAAGGTELEGRNNRTDEPAGR